MDWMQVYINERLPPSSCVDYKVKFVEEQLESVEFRVWLEGKREAPKNLRPDCRERHSLFWMSCPRPLPGFLIKA